MTVVIEGWVGRLGNNIIQLINAIHISLHINDNIRFPSHPYFKVNYIKITDKDSSKIITDEYKFFYRNRMPYKEYIYNQNVQKVRDIMRSIFTVNADMSSVEKNTCTVHIRSGDIFSRRPHQLYGQPPVSYYTNIINRIKPDNLIIIASDKKNPCIDKLLTLYPGSIYKQDTLTNDIIKILKSRTIICGVGSFIPSLLFLSRHIEKLYIPQRMKHICDQLTDVDIEFVNLKHYYDMMGPWKNTESQKHLMISYKPISE